MIAPHFVHLKEQLLPRELNSFDQELSKRACELKQRLSEALPSIHFSAARLSAFPCLVRFAGGLLSRALPDLPSLMDLAEMISEESEMT